MRPFWSSYRVAALCALSLVVAACGTTTPTRFYTLNSLPWPPQANTQERTVAIGIGPIELAAYLDREEIVTRRGPNELELAEFHRWAEPLQDNLSRILVEDLSSLLSADPVSVLPFPSPTPLDYRVEVKVLRLEGNLGEMASLDARWTLLGQEGKEALPTKEFHLDERIQGSDYESLVSAQSRAVAALSREIAEGIRAVLQGAPNR